MSDFDYITIEPVTDRHTLFEGEMAAYGHGQYPEHSVLAGQAQRAWLAGGTAEQLKTAYPHADVLDHSSKVWRDPNASLAELSGLPACAPDWFDPANAGERWDDDY